MSPVIQQCYPLVMSNIAIENGPVEIVDLLIKTGWIFPVRYVNVYQAGYVPAV